MRTIEVINTELDTELANYRANVDVWNRSQLEASNAIVKALRHELNEAYCEGAVIPESVAACMLGGLHGMPRVINNEPAFEIGCTVKVNHPVKGEINQGLCARGNTREQAVENWNNGIYAN
jgi:hypothetical protein